jgi:2-methylcitrate dehydratase
VDSITRQIAEFASTLAFRDLTAETVHAAKQRLVDALGCAVASCECEPARIGRRLAAGSTPGKYPGRVLLWGERLPAQDAAFVNTTMIRNLDFNDRYPGGHPSDCLGSLLALAEGQGADGPRLLTSMVVAYEVFARINDAALLSRRGWDQGYAVAVATAAGVGNLLGLSAEAMSQAVAIAAVASVPLRSTRSGELTEWKNAASAYATRDGLFAALLAAEGMAGPSHAFEGRHGLWDQITGPFELAPFPNAGGAFLTPDVLIKYWPVESNGQPVVWAALELHAEIDPNDIREIEVLCSDFAYREIGSEPEKWDPQTGETADHSLPYILARALIDGTIQIDSFGDEAVRDPSLRPLMAKIRVTPDQEIEALLPEMLLKVRATTVDGTSHDVEILNPLGHPANPMGDGHIEEKFLRLAEPVLGSERGRRVLERWWQIDTASDLGSALDLLDLEPAG